MGGSYSAAQELFTSEDVVEGPRAFAEKRKPRWTVGRGSSPPRQGAADGAPRLCRGAADAGLHLRRFRAKASGTLARIPDFFS